ncbi:CHAT domain-containing protein [Suillus subalutaceus]|uniref:CHAT domain-containing protein n=1 Tax=Suillus subalutaceus TaxID=48586 RepID=UPI001B86F6C6|nr:CHAT domain-containing protein [Suillus subalutaceus]KAG1850572.1 CHAT domain-containing protein [Suillus subalutaceus]
MLWDELLDHGDETFDISFPPVYNVHPSLTLNAAIVQTCDNQDSALSDSLVDCEITRDTDAGHARFAEYVTSKTVSHLNDAVEHFQLVLNQCPIDGPDHAMALTNLAYARLQGYICNDLQGIDFTTSLFREVLALRPQGHPDHPLALYNLIRALIWRNSKEPTAVYIHEFAELCCKLLPLCSEGTYFRRIGVDNAVNYAIGECNDLPIDASNEGIYLRRNVLELCHVGQQHRPKVLDKLSWALRSRFTQRGNIDDLDESIQFRREAVSLCPEGHPDRHDYLNNLAVSLGHYRFIHQGKLNDLNEAISLHEEALRLRPVGHISRDVSLDNLGVALLARFNKHHDIDDIDKAISFHREALTSCPPWDLRRDTVLNNLALALKTRYGELHVKEDLNEAIDLFRESIQIRRHDHPERHINLRNLSSALCSRFTQTRTDEDIEEAINLCQESLAALPSLHPDMYLNYMRLQETYLSRYQVRHNHVDLSLAMENFRLASRHPTQGLPYRIITARNWVAAAERYNHTSALEAYNTCFDLLDGHLATRSSTISRREAAAAFSSARSLPVDAASCAIRRDDLRRAVELVEQGRGQQWSLASRLRSPLEDLESTNSYLAHTFSELSKHLSDAQYSAGSTDRAATDRATTEYMRLTRQWEAAVAEIRNLQAFSRFLLPPLYADLQAAARRGPVIILVASEYSCSAIILPTSGEPHHVPLPSIALTDLQTLKDRFTRAIRQASRMNPKDSRMDLIVLLRITWDEIMLPIVNILEHVLKLKRRSRIWLCPTAAFTSIPLHAANPFLTKEDRSGKEPCLEDLYICSYTPTLSALIRSRRMMKQCMPPSFVAIGQGQPGARKGKALLAVDSELELVRKLVPATAKRTTISGDAATRAGALEALQENTWVHLACHGKQDPTQPYNSHFVMRDDHLTLLDIMKRDISHAEFAFLSACHTAVGDKETPDEVIHLAAGLQFSGFKSVIGTLWEVDDAVAKHVVEAFYENMFKDSKDGTMDCTKAAWALNCATHAVKTKVPLEQRMVFIHIGV